MAVEMNKSTVYETDKKHVWHALAPHTENNPWVVESAQGVYIVDMEGNRYLDGMSGLWCVNAGYGHERFARAAYEQMMKMPYYPQSSAHVPGTLVAAKVSQMLGADYKFFFNNSGSESNETAFKLARQFHIQNGDRDRYKIISRYRAYHGSTMGALAATGQQQRKFHYEPVPTGFVKVMPPDTYRRPEGMDIEAYGRQCAEELERVIQYEGYETVSAFIMEPIITGGGMIMPPQNYMSEVAKVCRKYGVLLISDEVISGFGRTGKNFGFQHFDVQPDIVTMAKGITSGYLPLAATAVRAELYEVFKDAEDPYSHFRQVNTFGGHPVSCAVALENLALFDELDLVGNSARMGEVLANRLQTFLALPAVGDVRSKGLLAGIELVSDKSTKQPLDAGKVKSVVARCKQNGLIVGRNGDTVMGYNNVITLSPPLIINEEQISFATSTLYEAIEAIELE